MIELVVIGVTKQFDPLLAVQWTVVLSPWGTGGTSPPPLPEMAWHGEGSILHHVMPGPRWRLSPWSPLYRLPLRAGHDCGSLSNFLDPPMTAFSMAKHYTLLIALGALYKSGATVKKCPACRHLCLPAFNLHASSATGSEWNRIGEFGESPITNEYQARRTTV